MFRFRFAKPEVREILSFSEKQIYNKVIVNQNAEEIYGGIVTVKLADISNGPDWLVWAAFIILAAISAVLISGHGSGLISGYNTATKEDVQRL